MSVSKFIATEDAIIAPALRAAGMQGIAAHLGNQNTMYSGVDVESVTTIVRVIGSHTLQLVVRDRAVGADTVRTCSVRPASGVYVASIQAAYRAAYATIRAMAGGDCNAAGWDRTRRYRASCPGGRARMDRDLLMISEAVDIARVGWEISMAEAIRGLCIGDTWWNSYGVGSLTHSSRNYYGEFIGIPLGGEAHAQVARIDRMAAALAESLVHQGREYPEDARGIDSEVYSRACDLVRAKKMA